MERAALYIRVSTDDQTEYSPDAQRKALLEYANKNNMIVSDEYIFVDEGYSGRTAEKRPAFMKMIGMAKSKGKPFDIILVHKFDRFARNREHSVVFKAQLKRDCGIKVISITESLEDEKMAVIIEPMLEGMAEYYSINLSEEVKKGMTEKALRGGFQTSPPFGYRIDDGRLLIDEGKAKYITYIFDQFVNHNKGCFPIARALNQMGVVSKRRNKIDNRGVQYILSNPIYIGMVRWTPTEKIRRNFNHPDSIIERGSHEPIISAELFERAQWKLQESRKKTKPNARPLNECKHWLSGLVKCSECGSTLVLSTKLRYPSFQCSKYSKGQCRVSHSITLNKLEEAIINQLSITIARIVDQDFQINIIRTDDKQLQIDSLRKKLDKNRAKLERAYESYLDGIDSKELYKQTKMSLDKEYDETLNTINELQNAQPEVISSRFQERLRNIVELLSSDCELEMKQAAIRAIIEKIVYDKANEGLELYYYDN